MNTKILSTNNKMHDRLLNKLCIMAFLASSLTLGSVSYAACTGGAGNGILEAGEECDLGPNNGKVNGADSDASPQDHGCKSDCTADSAGNWSCNTDQASYNTMKAEMEALWPALRDVTGLTFAATGCSGGGTNAPYNVGDMTSINNCQAYTEALGRFLGYNASHGTASSIVTGTVKNLDGTDITAAQLNTY